MDSHDATEMYARLLAEELARKHPKLITAKMAKQLRARKVFIDYSQNADYKTTVGVYSLRAKNDRPFVSMPVTWTEVERAKDLYWEPDRALQRLRRVGDLFAPLLRSLFHWQDASRRMAAGEDRRRIASLVEARAAAMTLRFIPPMECTAVAQLPDDREKWLYEVKLDGYRCCAVIRPPKAMLY